MVRPGGVALAAASRVADAETRRRRVLLSRLGANRRARCLLALPRVAFAGGLSLALTGALLAVAAATDVAMPFTGLVLDAAVVGGGLPLLAAVLIGATVVSAAALIALSVGSSAGLTATRLVVPRDRPAWARTGVLVALLAAQPWLLGVIEAPTLQGLVTLVAVAVAARCVPSAIATLAVFGSARRVALVLVVGHAAVILALFVGPAAKARQTAERIGTSMVVARYGEGADRAGAVVAFAHEHGLGAVRVDGFMATDELEIVVRVALPIAGGGLAGAAVTSWLLLPHTRAGAAPMPANFLLVSVLASMAVAFVSWLVARRLMAKTSRSYWGA